MDIRNIKIECPDKRIEKNIANNWDRVAKPLDGLGVFEKFLARIGAINGSENIDINKKAVIVMCADNGIVEEEVSQTGQEVTAAVTKNLGMKNTSVCKMAKVIGADIISVDIGVNSDEIFQGVLYRRVKKGTKNFAKEPAMTEEEAFKAIDTGISIVKECKENGYKLIGTGEMGIGNTTTSSAMAAAFLDKPALFTTGRGAGLDDKSLARKVRVVENALEKYDLRNSDAMKILTSVGGLDIAGLCGVFIGGAVFHVPIVIDGVISAVAALTAENLCPGVKEYMIPSHKGKEPAAALVMEKLGLMPVIDAGLALGEGTGAVMMFSLLDMAMSLYSSGATFKDFKIENYERFTKGI